LTLRVAGFDLLDPHRVGGGDICQSFSARTAAGVRVFVKTLSDAPAGFFEAEAAGLDRLRVSGGPRVPRTLAAAADGLVLEWIQPGSITPRAAARLGQRLARLHRSGGSRFGADGPGFVATVAIDNAWSEDWPTFYAQQRLVPALAAARQRGAIVDADAARVERVIACLPEVAGPTEAPSRIHGDLWQGNLLWADDDEVWLVDAAAAHDGHRETDLAMLALFGVPLQDEILTAYDATFPLTRGWRERIALHQLHPLLIHAVLFGGHYGARAGAAAGALIG
jgi:fructosamine-3-kinase